MGKRSTRRVANSEAQPAERSEIRGVVEQKIQVNEVGFSTTIHE